MNIFKKTIKIMTIPILFLGTVICLIAFENSQSTDNQNKISIQDPNAAIFVSKQLEILTKNPNEDLRRNAAITLGKAGDISTMKALAQPILYDSSYVVKIASMEARAQIYSKEVSELYRQNSERNIRGSIQEANEVAALKKTHAEPLKELFRSSYKIDCNYVDEVKAVAASSIGNLLDAKDLPIFLEELKRNCALTYNEREKRVSNSRPNKGDRLLSSLIGLITRPTSVILVSQNNLVYTRSIARDIIPHIEKELAQSTGDYKFCLIIILNHLSVITDFDIKEMKYMPVYEFDKNLLPLCEEGLLKTESPAIKGRLVDIMRANNYVPKSLEAQNIMKEIIAQRNSGTRAGGRR